MWDVSRKLLLDLALELVVEHVRLCDSQYAVLYKKLRIVFAKLVQEHFVSLSDVVLVSCDHEQEDGVTLDMSEESHSDTLSLVGSLDDTRDVCHHERLVVVVAYDTKVRLESGERIVSNLWTSCRNC